MSVSIRGYFSVEDLCDAEERGCVCIDRRIHLLMSVDTQEARWASECDGSCQPEYRTKSLSAVVAEWAEQHPEGKLMDEGVKELLSKNPDLPCTQFASKQNGWVTSEELFCTGKHHVRAETNNGWEHGKYTLAPCDETSCLELERELVGEESESWLGWAEELLQMANEQIDTEWSRLAEE
jgi:hypothetical protein